MHCRTRRFVEQLIFCLANHSQELLPEKRFQACVQLHELQHAFVIQSGRKSSFKPEHRLLNIPVAESDHGAPKVVDEVSQL